jgi:double-stranded uracil-DNA glycosylase
VNLRGIPLVDLPLALARVHAATPVGAGVAVSADLSPATRETVATGAGFAVGPRSRLVRLRTLPDIVGPGMRLLICGLNPSLYSADAGVCFARPGNRFWPAAIAAGLVTRDRDPWHALTAHGIGFTDLVKEASVGAAGITPAAYRAGAGRVAWVVDLLRPGAVCFVGVTGYRAVFDRRASPGPQALRFAGVPAYVMPNTSGLNAHAKPADFAEHLRAAAALAR